MKDYRDPREQVVATPESIAAAKVAREEEQEAFLGTYPAAERAHIRAHLDAALRGRVGPDLCSICGLPTVDHYMGGVYLGHAHAWRVADNPALRRPQHPLGYNDPHSYVTMCLQEALRADCGPEMTQFVATVGSDLLHQMAMQLCRVAVSAHLTEMAKAEQ